MPDLCLYGMCQNLGSSTYMGYCNEEHYKRGPEREILMKVLRDNPQLSTIRDARLFLTGKLGAAQDEKNKK